MDFSGIDRAEFLLFDGVNSRFLGTPIVGNFPLPFDGNDNKRDVGLTIFNEQNQLDLQITVKCNSDFVKAYLVTASILSANSTMEYSLIDEATMEITTYTCFERVRIKQNENALIILIQDAGSSVVSYQLENYMES